MPAAQGAYVELGATDVGLSKVLDASAARLKAWGASLISVGKQMAAIGAAATAAFGAAGVAFATAGGELERMSRRMGVPAEALQEWGFAAEQAGSSLAGLEASMRHVRDLQIDMATGGQEAADAFALVKLRAADLQGKRPDEVYRMVAERIAAIPNPALRAWAATKLLGDERLADLGKGLDDAAARARELGIVMSDETVRGAFELEKAMKALRDQGAAVSNAVGAALAPAMRDLAEALAPVVRSVIDWLRENKDTVVTVAKVALAVTGLGFALIGLGFTLKGVGVALGVVSLAFKALMISTIASAVKWGVWTAAVIIAKAATAGWAITAFAAKAAGAALSLALTAVQLAAAGTSAVMTTLTGVLGALSLAISGVALGGLLVLFGGLISAVYGVWTAALEVIKSVREADFGTAFADFIPVLEQWKGILADIVRAVKVDMGLAWELVGAAAELAVAQMKVIWPPLWVYIQNGFTALWAVIKAAFMVGFDEMFLALERRLLLTLRRFARFTPGVKEALDIAIKAGAFGDVGEGAQAKIDAAKERLEGLKAELAKALSQPIKFDVDTEEARAAQEKINEIRGRLAEAEEAAAQEDLIKQAHRVLEEEEARRRAEAPGGIRQAIQQADVVGTFRGGFGAQMGGTTVVSYMKMQLDKLTELVEQGKKPPPVFGAE